MQKVILFLLFFTCFFNLQSQTLTGIGTKWDDSFSEWVVFTDDEDINGELNMTWATQNDWSSFDYRIQDASGNIQLKWRDNPNEWETRGDNEIITARTMWRDDPKEWRITDNNITFQLKSKWGNNPNAWIITTDKYGYFEIYMDYKNDPRDWVIVDELSEEITLPMKMTLVFISVINSIPRF